MWIGVGRDEEDKQRIEQEKLEKISPAYGKFFSDLFTCTSVEIKSYNFQKLFPMKLWIHVDVNALNLPIRCETCSSYIGIDAIKRKLYKISVIRSYCGFFNQSITPNHKACPKYEPTNFWERAIRLKINKSCENAPDYSFYNYQFDIYEEFFKILKSECGKKEKTLEDIINGRYKIPEGELY